MKASNTVCMAHDFPPALAALSNQRLRRGARRSWGILRSRMDTPLGSPLRRKEDERFVTGRGRYVEDLRFPGMLHAAFVRSPYAHARVRAIDTAAAAAVPSVVAVYTARDLPEGARPIPPSMGRAGGSLRGLAAPPRRRHAGARSRAGGAAGLRRVARQRGRALARARGRPG